MKIILLSILLIFAIGIICEQSVFGSEEENCFEGYNDNCKESEHKIWDVNIPLTWDDFQGVPGSSCGVPSFPYYASPTACTYTKTSWQVWARESGSGCQITKLDVVALFGKFNSWVDLDYTEISYDDLLKHEQGHFDIAQIHAQKLKPTYEGKTFACPSGVQDMVDSKAFQSDWNEIHERQKAMQKTYDEETDTGFIAKEQAEWDKKIISLLSTGEYVEEVSIPKWIKNNAGWWAKGQIDDSAFVQGIQFLIKENIIEIPNLPEPESDKLESIPQWIKNNAKWWAKGQIDDSAFVQGIQFLIKVGIIQVEIELPDGWTDKGCHKYWETCLTYSD